MSLEAFASSRALSLGVELELQIVNTRDYDLTPGASDLLRVLAGKEVPGDIKPEITDSMVEVSTGVCTGHDEALTQLAALRDALVDAARQLNIGICGGGTHPFQHWPERRISDSPRFHQLSELYAYLSKQFTIFGQHVHIGCPGADDALWLLHALSRYVPHFIALSASSPFVQGEDTGFHSARLNSVFAFPLSGRAPFVLSWSAFETYFDSMTRTGVVDSMKDFYWDIRPKPEYGTIEIRVMDTPLTVAKAAAIAAYIQALAAWLLDTRPFAPREEDYLVYTFNRFQACRFGFEGVYVDPESMAHRTIGDDILLTLTRIAPWAERLGADAACRELLRDVAGRGNDATWSRGYRNEEALLPELVRQHCLTWASSTHADPSPV